jgi:hypothetical protein
MVIITDKNIDQDNFLFTQLSKHGNQVWMRDDIN